MFICMFYDNKSKISIEISVYWYVMGGARGVKRYDRRRLEL